MLTSEHVLFKSTCIYLLLGTMRKLDDRITQYAQNFIVRHGPYSIETGVTRHVIKDKWKLVLMKFEIRCNVVQAFCVCVCVTTSSEAKKKHLGEAA